MKSPIGRLYVGAIALLCFFVLWATVAAHPWAAAAKRTADPRLVALAARERRLVREAALVKRLLARRWAVYEHQLTVRRREIAAATTRHEQALAAARAAAARTAAATSWTPPASTPAPSAVPAATRVVTLPPAVQVVTLPAVTATSSSH